jgi:eukaryotic-like serine/threonine-protein kinase
LTDGRWRRIEALCHGALARPEADRMAYLAAACGSDETLRADVESLLARAASAESFLEEPLHGNSPLTGRQLGAYRLEAPIAAGGMGDVYRATDTRLGREVAVKVLPPAWTADPQRRIRFEREARAVAALNHPNICTIHDVGHDDGIDFLVLEFIDGESLAARLARGPLPFEGALDRAIEIADALDKAHRQGIVHRDLKPANVMLAGAGAGTGHAKLLDFGIARLVPSGPASAWAAPAPPPLTRVGAVVGTVQYMAPEQVEGRPADARTDIFAFGALLYEMLTGRPAFKGGSTAALIAAILQTDPPAVATPQIGRIVGRCLAKDPFRRYQSALDLLHDLEEARQDAASGRPRSSRHQRWFGRSGAAWLALGVGLAGIAAYGGWRSFSPSPTAVSPELLQIQPPAGVEILPWDLGSVLAVSPDGRWVAFQGADTASGERALYLRFLGDLEVKKIATAGRNPFFSADSRWLGFFGEKAMYKVPVAGGQPQSICGVPNVGSVRGASWGDGNVIVFSFERALWQVPASGGEAARITTREFNVRHYWPQVLPGSTAAVFTINQGSSDDARHIAVVSLATGDIRVLDGVLGTMPRYVPSGHLVFSRFGALHAAPFDLSRLQVGGEPVKIMEAVAGVNRASSASFDVSSTGALVYIPGFAKPPLAELVWLDRNGKTEPIVAERRAYVGGAIDPSGGRLGLTIVNELFEADIVVYDVELRSWTRLTTGMDVSPLLAWSPDGEWIAFTSFRSGGAELFRIRSRGGTPEPLASDDELWHYVGDVSGDGTLVFYSATTSQTDLMTLTLEPRSAPKAVTNTPRAFERFPVFSPNGRWIAYSSDETGSIEIHVRPYPGPGDDVRVSPRGGTRAWWREDGRELLYQNGREIWSVPVEPGPGFRHGTPDLLFTTEFLARIADGVLLNGMAGRRFAAIRREASPQANQMLVYAPHWLDEVKEALRRR